MYIKVCSTACSTCRSLLVPLAAGDGTQLGPKKGDAAGHVRPPVNMPGVGLPVKTAVAGIVGVSLAAAVGWHNREFMPAGWKPW